MLLSSSDSYRELVTPISNHVGPIIVIPPYKKKNLEVQIIFDKVSPKKVIAS
jgi:hypothetical protein